MGPRPTAPMIPAVGERVNRFSAALPTELRDGSVAAIGLPLDSETERGLTPFGLAQRRGRSATFASTASSTRSS